MHAGRSGTRGGSNYDKAVTEVRASTVAVCVYPKGGDVVRQRVPHPQVELVSLRAMRLEAGRLLQDEQTRAQEGDEACTGHVPSAKS